MLVDLTVCSALREDFLQQVKAVRPAHALKMVHALGADQDCWPGIVWILHSTRPKLGTQQQMLKTLLTARFGAS